jgi:hypothetical protein
MRQTHFLSGKAKFMLIQASGGALVQALLERDII